MTSRSQQPASTRRIRGESDNTSQEELQEILDRLQQWIVRHDPDLQIIPHALDEFVKEQSLQTEAKEEEPSPIQENNGKFTDSKEAFTTYTTEAQSDGDEDEDD